MTEKRPSPTVYGIETEYSLMLTFPGSVVHEIVGSCHSADVKLGLYKEPSKRGISGVPTDKLDEAIDAQGLFHNQSGMLSNGGRFYIDPSGPEYATPETRTAVQGVKRSFDGDKILEKTLEHLRQQEVIDGYQVNRRIVDHNRSSRGIHLNTTTNLPGDKPSPEDTQHLAALNVAKGAIFGSGGLLLDEQGETAFHHSPRLSLTTDVSRDYQDYSQRPLVRYPFKEDGELGRVETVTSDALNFAWPLRASLVASNALIGLLEMGYGDRLPVLRDPIAAARNVGKNGNANQVSVVDSDGNFRGVRPADILREICEVILEVDEKEDFLDGESKQVVPEIIDVSDRITADLYSVMGQVESVARLAAMEMKMDKDGIELGSETMCRFDYAWDWIGGGIAETLRNKGLVGWQGIDPEIMIPTSVKKLGIPPQDTRARVRGDMIQQSGGLNTSGWTNIGYGSGEQQYYISPLDNEFLLKPDVLELHSGQVFEGPPYIPTGN